jgi:hypothetical protein
MEKTPQVNPTTMTTRAMAQAFNQPGISRIFVLIPFSIQFLAGCPTGSQRRISA